MRMTSERLFLLGVVLFPIVSALGAPLIVFPGVKTLKPASFPWKMLALPALLLLLMPLTTTAQPGLHVAGFLARYMVPALLTWSAYQWLQAEKNRLMLLHRALLGAALGLSLWGAVSLYCSQVWGLNMGINPNILSGLLVILWPLYFSSRQALLPHGLLQSLLHGLLIMVVLGSGSRNALLGLGLIIGIQLWNARSTPYFRKGLMALLLVLMGTLLLKFTGALSLRGFDFTHATGRRVIFEVALQMIAQFPITGVGILSVESAYQHVHSGWPRAAHLHNWGLQVAAESGVPAALAFFTLLIYALWRKQGHRRIYKSLYGQSVLALLLLSLADALILDFRVMGITCLILAAYVFEGEDSEAGLRRATILPLNKSATS